MRLACLCLLMSLASFAQQTATAARSTSSDSVNIDADKQQGGAQGGVQGAVQKTLRISGRVVPEDSRVYKLITGPGVVKETYDDSVGAFVKKDQKLASYYSHEFSRQITEIQEPCRNRLRSLGLSELQIRQLCQPRGWQPPAVLDVVSPVDGFILERRISTNQTCDEFCELYRVADLSKVWILADIFGSDSESLRSGAVARVTLRGQGQSFTAQVSNVLLRLEADNPGFVLRPDMFVEVEVPIPGPSHP